MERYFYQANAVGFSGHIRRPFDKLIKAQASSALPSSGGFHRSRVHKFCHEGLVRFDLAETVVTGSASADGNSFDTLSSAVVENLNILGQVTADRVVGHMTSHYVRGRRYPVITALGSRFEGLRIAGQSIDVDLCRSEQGQALGKEPSEEPSEEQDREQRDLPVLTSLVTDLPEICDSAVSGNRIAIPQFGRIHLAEYLITPFSRRLIMIRLELGSPMENDSSVCDIEGGGGPFPPG
ncbi:MAG: choice-of-anchor P family protein [Bryobacteraceae bacterium]